MSVYWYIDVRVISDSLLSSQLHTLIPIHTHTQTITFKNQTTYRAEERIAKVNETIVAPLYNGKDKTEIPLDTIVAEIEYSTGLTPKRIFEYAAIGEKRGRFVIDAKNNLIKKPEV